MASKRKVAAKPHVWNKDLAVGKRDGFTPAQVKRIRDLLADRGVPGLRDLALFSTAVDTMLHGQLLPLVVGEVQRRNGSIRPIIEVARARGKPPVRCALSKVSAKALAKWIASRTDYLFPGDAFGSRPMSGRQLNRLLKLWVAEAGLDPTDYGVESEVCDVPHSPMVTSTGWPRLAHRVILRSAAICPVLGEQRK
jgi:hypothetical protein